MDNVCGCSMYIRLALLPNVTASFATVEFALVLYKHINKPYCVLGKVSCTDTPNNGHCISQ